MKDSIEAAGKSGRQISIRTYQGSSFDHVRTVHSPIGKTTLGAMNSEWLSLFVDGRQFLIASLTRDTGEVLEAIWSANMYLARVFYSHVNTDLFHYSFSPILEKATSVEEVMVEYQRLDQEFPPGGDLGFKDMIDAFNTRTGHPSNATQGD